jgi:hypothetical protein
MTLLPRKSRERIADGKLKSFISNARKKVTCFVQLTQIGAIADMVAKSADASL